MLKGLEGLETFLYNITVLYNLLVADIQVSFMVQA